VVLGHRADEIEPAVRDFPITLVRNPGYVQSGVFGARRSGGAVVQARRDRGALADMPLLPPRTSLSCWAHTSGARKVDAGALVERARQSVVLMLPC